MRHMPRMWATRGPCCRQQWQRYEAKDKSRNRVCSATKPSSGTPVQRNAVAKLDGDLNLRVTLQSGSRSWYLLYVENLTNIEVRAGRISIERHGIALMEPVYPKDGDSWVLPPKVSDPSDDVPKRTPEIPWSNFFRSSEYSSHHGSTLCSV